MTNEALENEIISVREFEATRERVFEAWADPSQLAQWWGPKGFRNTFETFELKPGGDWRFVMHGPNGTDYSNYSVFAEIVSPERIVLDHISSPKFRVTAIFEDLGGRTKLTFRQLFEVKAQFEAVKAHCIDGNEQNFDRLGELLATGSVSLG